MFSSTRSHYPRINRSRLAVGRCVAVVSSSSSGCCGVCRRHMDRSKYAAVTDVFKFAWSDAVCGFWTKYPNQYSAHVLTEDVLERSVTADGRLRSLRIISKTNRLPAWGGAVFKSNMSKTVQVLEESIVSPPQKTMVVYTWNVQHRHLMEVHEKLTIRPEQDDTKVVREGWVDSSVTGFRRVLRKFGISRWKANAKKSSLGYLAAMSGHVESVKRMAKAEQTFNSAKVKAKNVAHLAQSIVPHKSVP